MPNNCRNGTVKTTVTAYTPSHGSTTDNCRNGTVNTRDRLFPQVMVHHLTPNICTPHNMTYGTNGRNDQPVSFMRQLLHKGKYLLGVLYGPEVFQPDPKWVSGAIDAPSRVDYVLHINTERFSLPPKTRLISISKQTVQEVQESLQVSPLPFTQTVPQACPRLRRHTIASPHYQVLGDPTCYSFHTSRASFSRILSGCSLPTGLPYKATRSYIR